MQVDVQLLVTGRSDRAAERQAKDLSKLVSKEDRPSRDALSGRHPAPEQLKARRPAKTVEI